MNTKKFLTPSIMVAIASVMFYLRSSASNPCPPPDCCPPLRLVAHTLENSYEYSSKVEETLQICSGEVNLGAEVSTGNDGSNVSSGASFKLCWRKTAEVEKTKGTNENPPSSPPCGKWHLRPDDVREYKREWEEGGGIIPYVSKRYRYKYHEKYWFGIYLCCE